MVWFVRKVFVFDKIKFVFLVMYGSFVVYIDVSVLMVVIVVGKCWLC